MPRPTGPFDGRRKRKRCLQCVKAHAKCDGQVPCSQCFLSGQMCAAASAVPQQIVPSSFITQATTINLHPSSVPSYIQPDWTDRCLTHFFTSFLRQHDFTGASLNVYEHVQDLLHTCPYLRSSILAISSLDVVLHHASVTSKNNVTALKHYQNAVMSVRRRLVNLSSADDIDASLLWSTLFLGVFELMTDASGRGFCFHFIEGTTTLLRLKGPQSLDDNELQFFRLARIFEMTRDAIFWTDSFLEEIPWQTLVESLIYKGSQDGSITSGGVAFENMCSFVRKMTKLAANILRIVRETPPEGLTTTQVADLKVLASEGIILQTSLDSWHHSNVRHFRTGANRSGAAEATRKLNVSTNTLSDEAFRLHSPTKHLYVTQSKISSSLLLAQIYFHAISLNLAAIFDSSMTPGPFPHFIHHDIPVLSPSFEDIQNHVMLMLALLECALERTTLAGVLLCWPLRAAGARAFSKSQILQILRMFDTIEEKGFVVARTFKNVCISMWWNPRGLV